MYGIFDAIAQYQTMNSDDRFMNLDLRNKNAHQIEF